MVRFARRNGLSIAARGQAHQPFGQAQVSDGIVIDMRSLSSVQTEDDQVTVGAGATWRDVLSGTVSEGRMPPVLTNFLGLTVGGTLSIGGIGLATLRHGAQVDQVRALSVVTGEGRVLTCSDRERPELFAAALAGQGQCAIITQAQLALVAAPPMLREYLLQYSALSTLLADQQRILRDGRFDGAVGLVVAGGDGWSYTLQVVRYFTPPALPDDAALLAELAPLQGSVRTRDMSFFEYADELAPPPASGAAHADLGLMLAGPEAAHFLDAALPRLHAGDLGAATALRVFSWKRELFTRALFRVPDAEICVYVAMLRAEAAERHMVARMLAGNRALFEQNRALGGTLYPFSALELTRDDWREHYQKSWHALIAAKRRYDPDHVFASGPDVA
jgi:FAD/FMN-containing dehydrogenase